MFISCSSDSSIEELKVDANVENNIAEVKTDFNKIIANLKTKEFRTIEEYSNYFEGIKETNLDENKKQILKSEEKINVSNDVLEFVDSLNNQVLDDKINPEDYRKDFVKLLNNSKLQRGSYEYEVFLASIDLSIEIYNYHLSLNEQYNTSDGYTKGFWSVAKCIGGTIGSTGLGFLAGTAVGTVTLPIVGTVSGAAIGAVSGALTGAATFC